jgi:hypothetical protein
MATQEQLQRYLTAFLESWNASDKSKGAYGRSIVRAELVTNLRVRDKAGPNTIALSQIPSYSSLTAPPQPAPAVPAKKVVRNNRNNLNRTEASDDKSYDKVETARLSKLKTDYNTGVTDTKNTSTTDTAPDKPGRRQFNPLSEFSSYNYQITLYMITPDAYQAFVESGRKNINALVAGDPSGKLVQGTGGACIVAQSGGLGTTIPRAPGMELDFYIDNLKITAAPAGPSTTSATSVTSIAFTIYEPYGFSLVSKLQKAGETLRQTSKLKNKNDLDNYTRGFFILGIRFLGYDAQGNIITEKNVENSSVAPDAGGMFERFYDIRITNMLFKLDGKISTYNFSATSISPLEAFGNIRGRIKKDARLVASTVYDALKGPQGLLTQLNKQQEELKKQNGPSGKPTIAEANVYDVEFLGDSDDIKNAEVVTEADKKNKLLWPMSQVSNTQQVNDTLTVTATPNNNKRTITFSKETSMIQAVSSIISQSKYLSNALIASYGNEIDGMANVENQERKATPKPIKWYSLTSQVIPRAWDPIVGDYAYNITYYIQPYETPYVASAYVSNTTRYQGPYKRYDYWLTGQNSEILNFEQQFDNSFYNATVQATGSPESHGRGANIPTVPNTQQNEDKTGQLNAGKQAENSYLTSLYSPRTWSEAKITIIGDPDYLMQDTPNTINTVYRQFYGSDGFTINGTGGQVFIEIDFKEGVDYNNDNGLMTINESILFWKYPPELKNIIKGVAFQVIGLESRFQGGKFTQVLECRPTPFDTKAAPEGKNAPAATARESTPTRRSSGEATATDPRRTNLPTNSKPAAAASQNITTLGSGFVTDVPAPNPTEVRETNSVNLGYPTGGTQITSPTGGGPGLNDPVAGSSINSLTLRDGSVPTPIVNKNVVNDDAISTLSASSKVLINGNDGGRETTNPDQFIRENL